MHRHHACIDVTAASKSYNEQNAAMKDSAKLLQNKHTDSLKNHVQS